MSAINEWFGGYSAMFNYIRRTYGEDELERYLSYLAKTAYNDVTPIFRSQGLPAIESRYVKNFRIDGGEQAASSRCADGVLTIDIHCPAFHNRPVEAHPDRQCGEFFCQCCRTLNAKILTEAGFSLNIAMEHCGDCVWTVKQEVEST